MVTVSDFINYLAKVKDKGKYIKNADCGFRVTSVSEQDEAVYIYFMIYDKPLSIRNLIDRLITIDKPNYEIRLINGSIKFILDWYTLVFIGSYELLNDRGGTFIFKGYGNV